MSARVVPFRNLFPQRYVNVSKRLALIMWIASCKWSSSSICIYRHTEHQLAVMKPPRSYMTAVLQKWPTQWQTTPGVVIKILNFLYHPISLKQSCQRMCIFLSMIWTDALSPMLGLREQSWEPSLRIARAKTH